MAVQAQEIGRTVLVVQFEAEEGSEDEAFKEPFLCLLIGSFSKRLVCLLFFLLFFLLLRRYCRRHRRLLCFQKIARAAVA